MAERQEYKTDNGKIFTESRSSLQVGPVLLKMPNSYVDLEN